MASDWYVYRRLWEAEHSLPWPCYFCGDPVVKWGPRRLDGGFHHIDGNHTNNALENITPAHNTCHISHHRAGTLASAETKAKLSAMRKGVPKPPGFGDKIRASGSVTKRWTCPDCGADVALTWKSRHRCGQPPSSRKLYT